MNPIVGAYILITAAPGKAGSMLRKIAGVSGVKFIHAVTGPYDAIAYIEVPNFSEIGDLVVSQVQKVDGVSRTLTCIAVPL